MPSPTNYACIPTLTHVCVAAYVATGLGEHDLTVVQGHMVNLSRFPAFYGRIAPMLEASCMATSWRRWSERIVRINQKNHVLLLTLLMFVATFFVWTQRTVKRASVRHAGPWRPSLLCSVGETTLGAARHAGQRLNRRCAARSVASNPTTLTPITTL